VNVRDAFSTFRGHRVPNVNLIGRRRLWFTLSGILILLSLGGLVLRGLNFSIAFTGGSLLQFENRSGASVAQYQQVMAGVGLPDAQIEILGGNQVSVRTESLAQAAASEAAGASAEAVRTALAERAGITPDDINETDVGPTWGSTISRKMLTGLIVFLLLVSLYISLRFEWKMAVGGNAALGHDLIITAGIYALVGREVTPETVIAILTILGYSLYDTVVIFDKVKENTESVSLVSRETYSGVVNLSLNQTLMRSVNTSLSTLLPIGALLLFGGQTLKDFAFALFVGVGVGTYSSLFVASPLLALLKEQEPRYQSIRARAEARAARPGLRAVPSVPAAPAVTEREGTELEPAAVAAEGRARPIAQVPGAPPRSRGSSSGQKKRKKSTQGRAKRRRR
jgi:preprotein translocase subunit SecF